MEKVTARRLSAIHPVVQHESLHPEGRRRPWIDLPDPGVDLVAVAGEPVGIDLETTLRVAVKRLPTLAGRLRGQRRERKQQLHENASPFPMIGARRQSLRIKVVATAAQGGSSNTCCLPPAPSGRIWIRVPSRPIRRPNT